MSLLKIRKPKHHDSQEKPLENIAPAPKNSIGISEQARARLIFLKPGATLRIAIQGGGCSGLTLHYEFCESLRPHDHVFENGQARICIDPKSLGLLGGATLHFKEELGVGEFVLLNNPSEKQCSCGKSFSL